MLALWIGSIALVIAVIALVLAVTVTRRVGERDPLAVPRFWRRLLRVRTVVRGTTGAFTVSEPDKQRIAFVANPTKEGVQEMHERALRACSIRYLPQPMWFHTTEEDPGYGQARDAIRAGADLVVAVGGDGTVRAEREIDVGGNPTLYDVLRGDGATEGVVELDVPAGVSVYTFTFG